jgi:hypothetical protein
MDQPATWTHAIVEIVATDAWIPVDDAQTIAEFAADPAYVVHDVPNPATLVALLQRPHEGRVRAARELLGMLPSDLFQAFLTHLSGSPQPKPPVRRRRPGRS